MVQYEMYFTNEYLDDIINDLAVIMELNVEKKVIDTAMQERDKSTVMSMAKNKHC